MLFLALGSTVAGMLLWNRAIVRGGSTRISRLLYLEPVVSVLGAMVFLGERATAAVLAGGVLVIAGVLVTGDSADGGKPDERHMVAGSGRAAPALVHKPGPPQSPHCSS
jgi:threonine/homoserine efflux transporter RhtA